MEDRLRKFARLAESGSFTKAAAELHVSQPALSAAVAKLERELKARLFVRGSRPLTLTPAGELAHEAALALGAQTDNLKLRLAELAKQPVALRIGMIDSIADLLFAGHAALNFAHDAEISLTVNNSRYLAEAVGRGEIDAAFVAKGRGSLPAVLEFLPVAPEPLVVVGQSLYKIDGAKLPDFIAYDRPSNTFRLVDEALRRYGVTAQTSFYSTSPDVTLRLVLQGKGSAALPYLMVREHLKSGELQRLGEPQPWLIKREIVTIKRRDRELPRATIQVTQHISSTLTQLTAEAQR